jgi:hypothetical protein
VKIFGNSSRPGAQPRGAITGSKLDQKTSKNGEKRRKCRLMASPGDCWRPDRRAAGPGSTIRAVKMAGKFAAKIACSAAKIRKMWLKETELSSSLRRGDAAGRRPITGPQIRLCCS